MHINSAKFTGHKANFFCDWPVLCPGRPTSGGLQALAERGPAEIYSQAIRSEYRQGPASIRTHCGCSHFLSGSCLHRDADLDDG
jgi:hypothetical protein